MSEDELFGIPRGLHEQDFEQKQRKIAEEENRRRAEENRRRNEQNNWNQNDGGGGRRKGSGNSLNWIDLVFGFIGTIAGLSLTEGEVVGAVLGAIVGLALRSILAMVAELVKIVVGVGFLLLVFYLIYTFLTGG